MRGYPTKEEAKKEIEKTYPSPKYIIEFSRDEDYDYFEKKYLEKLYDNYYFLLNYDKFLEQTKIGFILKDYIKTATPSKSYYGPDVETLYYLVIDTEIMEQIKSELIKRYNPKKFFKFVKKERWYHQVSEYVFYLPDKNLKLFIYNIHSLQNELIRTNLFSLELYKGTGEYVKIKIEDQKYVCKIKLGESKDFVEDLSLEWYDRKEQIPLFFFEIPEGTPEQVRKLVLSIFKDDIQPEVIKDGEDIYEIYPIVYDIIKDEPLQNLAALTKKLKYTQGVWRNYNISYKPEYDKLVKENLEKLDKNKIEFSIDKRNKIKNIIFSDIRGMTSEGRVTIEEKNAYIDLHYAGTDTILHELLHITTITIDWLPFLREAFNSVMTFIIFESPISEFKESMEKTIAKKYWHISPGRYVLFPYFIYKKFVIDNIESFKNMFFAEDTTTLNKYLKEVFSDRLFYEEILFLESTRPDFAYDENNDRKLFYVLYTLYFKKEVFSKNYTYQIFDLTGFSVGYINKITGEKEYYDYRKFMEDTPELKSLLLKLDKIYK